MKDKSYEDILKEANMYLEAAGITDASIDAWILFEEVYKIGKAEYILNKSKASDVNLYFKYLELIKLRAQRVPLQHILGYTYFYGRRFMVNQDVLVPRQETELLVEKALEYMKEIPAKSFDILDLCTGSGCIAVSLACEGSIQGIKTTVTASDISEKALKVAEKNIDINNACVNLIHSDMFHNINEKFDIIISNPPYIESSVIKELECEVKDYDPITALDGGEDGLLFYRIIAKESTVYLKENALLLLEIGYNQAEYLKEILKENGFYDIEVFKDYSGNDRIVKGRK